MFILNEFKMFPNSSKNDYSHLKTPKYHTVMSKEMECLYINLIIYIKILSSEIYLYYFCGLRIFKKLNIANVLKCKFLTNYSLII